VNFMSAWKTRVFPVTIESGITFWDTANRAVRRNGEKPCWTVTFGSIPGQGPR
jgi:hypothetical protein